MYSRPRMRVRVGTSCRLRAVSHSCSTIISAAAVCSLPGALADAETVDRAMAAMTMTALESLYMRTIPSCWACPRAQILCDRLAAVHGPDPAWVAQRPFYGSFV